MSQYKISKARLKEIIKEEYEAAMTRTDEGHGAFGIANRDEEPEAEEKEKEDEKVDEAHCGSANRAAEEPGPERAIFYLSFSASADAKELSEFQNVATIRPEIRNRYSLSSLLEECASLP